MWEGDGDKAPAGSPRYCAKFPVGPKGEKNAFLFRSSALLLLLVVKAI